MSGTINSVYIDRIPIDGKLVSFVAPANAIGPLGFLGPTNLFPAFRIGMPGFISMVAIDSLQLFPIAAFQGTVPEDEGSFFSVPRNSVFIVPASIASGEDAPR